MNENIRIIGNLKWVIKIIYGKDKAYVFFAFLSIIVNGTFNPVMLLVMQKIVNSFQEYSNGKIVYHIILYVLIQIVVTGFNNYTNLYYDKFERRFNVEVGEMILKKIKHLKLSDFENSDTLDIISRAQNVSGSDLVNYFRGFISMSTEIISLFSYLTILLFLKVWIVIVVMTFPIVTFIFDKKINKRIFEIVTNRTNDSRKIWYIQHLITYGSYFKELRIFDLFDMYIEKYKKINAIFNQQDDIIIRDKTILITVIGFIEGLFSGGIFYYIIGLGMEKKILLGDVITYSRAIMDGKNTILTILLKISSLFKESLFIDQLKYFLNINERICNKSRQVNKIKKIEIKNLYFSYGEKCILNNINLTIDSNEKIAIVGRNGCGKTTLSKIIMGLYEDYDGEILINGISLKEYDIKSYYKKISGLFQDYVKFEATIRENIAFGNIKIIYDDEKIYDIAKKFNILDMICNFKNGLDTQLGMWFDDGISLSVGQWQKIALCRAFSRDSDLIVLDEPNASMDNITDREISDLYSEIMKDRIGIIIAHKFNRLVEKMDKIIVMDNGKIVEIGTHDELIKKNGIYRKMSEI